MLCSVLGSPIQNRPMGGQVAGAQAVGGEAEGLGLSQPGEFKARGGTLTAPSKTYKQLLRQKT